MKNLDAVKKFYREVEKSAKFDFGRLADEFEGHDIFANPPQGHTCALPFFGEVELFLVAIVDTWIDRATIAIDDGKYEYKSRVVFLAKATPVLEAARYQIIKYGPFAGMVELSCNQSNHSCLFGHPAEYYTDKGWLKRSPEEFVTELLPALIKNTVSRFYPVELHQYPFTENGQQVNVFAQDVNKMGGYTQKCLANEAEEKFQEMARSIYDHERGNVNVAGYISAKGVRWVIPAFGKSHVAFVD